MKCEIFSKDARGCGGYREKTREVRDMLEEARGCVISLTKE